MTSSDFTPKEIARFWAKVKVLGPDDCWEWQRAKSSGYGRLTIRNKNYSAARFSYCLHIGVLPDDIYVLHKCDNPPCVNPAHLFQGTQKDNMADKVAKGRQPSGVKSPAHLHPERMARGEEKPDCKLSERQVMEIRSLYVPNTMSFSMLARRYGVSIGTVFYVVHRKTWAHVK